MPPERTYNLKKIIFIGLLVLILVGIIGYFVISKTQNQDAGDGAGKNLFPFGDSAVNPKTPTSADQPGIITPPTNENPLTITEPDRLRVIANYPVTNYYSFIQNKTATQPKINEVTGEQSLVSITTPVNTLRFNVKESGSLVTAELYPDSIIVAKETTTRIPVAEELWFSNQGKTAIFRTWNDYENTIDSFLGSLPPEKQLGYCEQPITKTLAVGLKNDPHVKELQKYIAKKLIVTITPDGNYGPQTSSYVKKIQKLFGFTETGSVDSQTQIAINNDCAQIVAQFKQDTQGPYELSGGFLAENILRGDASPDGSNIFFVKKTTTGSLAGILTNALGQNQKTIFDSPFTEWKPRWVNNSIISMTTLASREANGYMYSLNPSNGAFIKILGPIRGLTTLMSPDAKKVLYTTSTDTGILTRIYSVDDGNLLTIDIPTFTEKCTWKDSLIVICAVPETIPKGAYPDSWYQGIVSLKDSFWSINTTTGAVTLIFNTPFDTDATHLGMSSDQNYLYFINKNDETLWSYRMN